MLDPSTLLTLLVLAVAAASVLGFGMSVVRRARERRQRPAEAQGPRHWSNDEYAERLRNVYFQKERHARALRERERQARAYFQGAHEPDREPSDATGDGQTSGTPLITVPDEARFREVLELEGEITPEGVRFAYLRLVAAYHPDKVAGLGVKLQEVAEEETKSINEAYTFFRKRYGL